MGGMDLSRDSSSLLIMATMWKCCPARWSWLLQGVFCVHAGPGTPRQPPRVGNGLWDTQEQPHPREQWVTWAQEGEPTNSSNAEVPSKRVWGTAKSQSSMDGQYQPNCQDLLAQVPTFSWLPGLAQASQWLPSTDRYQVSLWYSRRGIFALAYFTMEPWSCCSWDQEGMEEYLTSRIMVWMWESMSHCMIFQSWRQAKHSGYSLKS